MESCISIPATCAEHNPCVHYLYYTRKAKVKQPLGVPGSGDSQIARQFVHEGGKVVSPMRRPPLPPRKYPRFSFLLEAKSTAGLQCGRKDYVYEKLQ